MKEAFWIDKYRGYLSLVKGRADNTVRAFCSDVLLFSKFITCEQWADVTEETAGSYVQHLQGAGATDTTVARKIASLKSFFIFLRREHVIAESPFRDVEFARYYKPLPNPLTVDEMNRLLGCIREPLPGLMGLPTNEIYLTVRDKAMLETMYSCGLRVSEISALDWENVSWSARELKVFGKGSKERIVPLGQVALDALLVFAKHYEARFRRKAQGPFPIFISHCNRRIDTRSIPRVIKKWATKAGITRRVNPHSFRHSCAQHMLDSGADIRAVQTLLGHSNVSTTQIYTSVSTRKLKAIHGVTHPRA